MIREKEKRDLNNLKADYYNSFFSHIYVEKSVADIPDTVRILNKFPQSHIIYISTTTKMCSAEAGSHRFYSTGHRIL